jgi:hypothetical protein
MSKCKNMCNYYGICKYIKYFYVLTYFNLLYLIKFYIYIIITIKKHVCIVEQLKCRLLDRTEFIRLISHLFQQVLRYFLVLKAKIDVIFRILTTR